MPQSQTAEEEETDKSKQGQTEQTSYAFPVILAEKKDGNSRFCVDYRKQNKITRHMAINLPLIDDVLNRLSGAKFFTSIDLRAGYWQVKCHESSQDLTANCIGAFSPLRSCPVDYVMLQQYLQSS